MSRIQRGVIPRFYFMAFVAPMETGRPGQAFPRTQSSVCKWKAGLFKAGELIGEEPEANPVSGIRTKAQRAIRVKAP